MAEWLIEYHGPVERWTINGEARRNALSKAMVAELASHVARVSAPPRQTRVVVLTGAGQKAFCAGADLKERLAMTEAEVTAFLATLRDTFRSLERSDCVFVAFLNGAAFGGGLELALSCDLRVVDPTAEMGLTEVKLGIIPGAGGTQRLTRLVGRGVAKDLILTGRRVGADEALSLGLVNRVGQLDDAMHLAKMIAENAPLAVSLAKHAVDDGAHLDLDAGLELEQLAYHQTLGTADRLEGLRAFAEKRAPVFKGV